VAASGKLSAELTMQAKLTHSETLMPHIEQVLKMAAVPKDKLEGIAVSIGPGSFTGLRIGLAAAKAMSSTGTAIGWCIDA
jgi:tRNA threonylcarbamoyladenosine biosynthesis protein TsaB